MRYWVGRQYYSVKASSDVEATFPDVILTRKGEKQEYWLEVKAMAISLGNSMFLRQLSQYLAEYLYRTPDNRFKLIIACYKLVDAQFFDKIFTQFDTEAITGLIKKMCDLSTPKIKATIENASSEELNEDQKRGDFNFHDIIKVLGMKYRLPTQLILPTTFDLKRKSLQDLATRAWNLSVAVYYKTKGVPWKLAELEPDTCYAGISFYRDCSPEGTHYMRAGVARVFLATGEALILKGDPLKWNQPGLEPHLNEEQAIALMNKIIVEYTKES